MLLFVCALTLVGCSDDMDDAASDVEFCVRAVWSNGLEGRSSRSLTATDILADTQGDIEIAFSDYPATINVSSSGVADFVLTKSSSACTEHPAFWNYCTSLSLKDVITAGQVTLNATAVVDNGGTSDVVAGTCTYDSSSDEHVKFILHHTKALVRFSFKVDPRYDKIRFIRVKSISLNGSDCVLVDKVLSTSRQFIAYAYVDPAAVTTTTPNDVVCTYNIYDKDAAIDDHLTREGVTAKNTFRFNSLKDAYSNPVTEIKAGYYYDLNVTLNPDYLYVLGEHDIKHMTIN